MKNDLARVSISLEEPLLEAFDDYVAHHGYATRSEAIRDLIREKLIDERQRRGEGPQVGVLSLVYDHHRRDLANRLIGKQHAHHDLTVASMHVHLGAHHCLEVSVLRGQAEQIRELADSLRSTKGVLHGDFRITGEEEGLVALAGKPHTH